MRAVRAVAYSSAATIAPVPGHWPSAAGNVRSRPAAIISAPASTAWVAVAQLGEVEVVVAGDDHELGLGGARRCR